MINCKCKILSYVRGLPKNERQSPFLLPRKEHRMYSNNAQEVMEKHRKRPLDQPEYYTVFSLYGYFTVHYTSHIMLFIFMGLWK